MVCRDGPGHPAVHGAQVCAPDNITQDGAKLSKVCVLSDFLIGMVMKSHSSASFLCE